MNKDQRKEVEAICTELEALTDADEFPEVEEIVKALGDAILGLQGILSDEEEKYDNLSDAAQEGTRGQELDESIGTLEEAIEHLKGVNIDEEDEGWKDDVVSAVTDAIDELNNLI